MPGMNHASLSCHGRDGGTSCDRLWPGRTSFPDAAALHRLPYAGRRGAWLVCDMLDKACFHRGAVCDRLGIPFPYDQGEGVVSAAAIADPPEWDRARAAVAFDELSRQLIHALKC